MKNLIESLDQMRLTFRDRSMENLEVPLWKALKKKSKWQRCLWTSVFAACGLTILYQTTDRVQMLLNSPKSASVTLALADELEFPAVTICPAYPLRRSLTANTEVDLFGCGFEQMYGCDWMYPWNTFTHNEAMIRECKFKTDLNCLPGAEKIGKWERLLTSMGRCFTYRSKAKLTLGGDLNGLRLAIEPMMNDKLGPSLFNGVRIFVHPVNETPLVETTGINVNEGASVAYALVLKQYHWIYDKEQNPCVQDRESYSQNKCISTCIFETAMKEALVQCRAPFMTQIKAKICSNRKTCTALWSRYVQIQNNGTYWQACSKRCPDPCKKMTYKPITASLGFTRGSNNTIISINVYFRDMWLESIAEEWDYNFNEFLSDTGGSLNLFWGASFILFLQVAEYLLAKVIYQRNWKCSYKVQNTLINSGYDS